MVFPNHLSFLNVISDPSIKEKEPYGKKYFFDPVRPVQKCESLGFQ
jgi:hypothetical protein